MAQGTLNFASGNALVRYYDGGPVVPFNAAQVQFAWAEIGTPFVPWTPAVNASAWSASNPGWTAIGAPATVGIPAAGRFAGGTLIAQTAIAGAVIQGVVIGWTGTGAANFLEGYNLALIQGGGFAVTLPFTVNTGDPTVIPPGTSGNIYNSTATPFTGLVLLVPEPSSIALVVLGSVVALLRKQAKSQLQHQ